MSLVTAPGMRTRDAFAYASSSRSAGCDALHSHCTSDPGVCSDGFATSATSSSSPPHTVDAVSFARGAAASHGGVAVAVGVIVAVAVLSAAESVALSVAVSAAPDSVAVLDSVTRWAVSVAVSLVSVGTAVVGVGRRRWDAVRLDAPDSVHPPAGVAVQEADSVGNRESEWLSHSREAEAERVAVPERLREAEGRAPAEGVGVGAAASEAEAEAVAVAKGQRDWVAVGARDGGEGVREGVWVATAAREAEGVPVAVAVRGGGRVGVERVSVRGGSSVKDKVMGGGRGAVTVGLGDSVDTPAEERGRGTEGAGVQGPQVDQFYGPTHKRSAEKECLGVHVVTGQYERFAEY